VREAKKVKIKEYGIESGIRINSVLIYINISNTWVILSSINTILMPQVLLSSLVNSESLITKYLVKYFKRDPF
jgi:hypothetical protein